MPTTTTTESTILELKGTHGTCIAYAEDIKKNGFNLKTGRRGYGAYFWAYRGEGRAFANCLAKAWWCYAFESKQYSSSSNESFEVLNVKLHLEEIHFLDLDNHLMKLKLTEFINGVYKRAKLADHMDLASKAYDLFVQQIEKHSNKIKVVNVSVNPPARKYFKDECTNTIRSEAIVPACYVVRDKHCINLV